ncbi:hypothetical protein Goarm_011169 [Gossypium armourianum]|uniref:Uncharacterized protein n=1 Tax=Gossypium armourianum TaxID=34283 RepID=A0A7J9IXJ0_9ROSI|nr:hypothetical protein [Gossypium armourianum]
MEAFVMNNEMKGSRVNHEMKAFVANHEMKWNALVKAKMKACIKSIDERVWCLVLTGWQAFTVNFEVRNIPKPKFEWTTKEERVVNVKSKALYVVFCGMNTLEFKRDFKCTVAKEDSKNIGKFYANLCDLSNQAFDLGKEYSNLKLVRKVLRSLLESFSIEVTTIKDAKDLEIKKKTNDDPNEETEEEFLRTYKNMLGKLEHIKAKESLLTKELDNLVNKMKDLAETKLMLKKFNIGSNKLDEILAASRRDIGRSGLGFVDKGKAVMKSPTVFVKGSIHAESEECSSKAAMIKLQEVIYSF